MFECLESVICSLAQWSTLSLKFRCTLLFSFDEHARHFFLGGKTPKEQSPIGRFDRDKQESSKLGAIVSFLSPRQIHYQGCFESDSRDQLNSPGPLPPPPLRHRAPTQHDPTSIPPEANHGHPRLRGSWEQELSLPA